MRLSEKGQRLPERGEAGSVVVKVYRLRHSTTATGHVYAVAWIGETGRKTKQYADEGAAMAEARLKACNLRQAESKLPTSPEAIGTNGWRRGIFAVPRRSLPPCRNTPRFVGFTLLRSIQAGH